MYSLCPFRMCDVHLFVLRNKWLTKPFCSTDRREHTHTDTHSLVQADMCSAQPVIAEALMWSLGGTDAFYCCFMTTFTLLLRDAPPPSSFPHSFPYPCVSAPHPTSSQCVQTHIHFLAVAMGCLFVFRV